MLKPMDDIAVSLEKLGLVHMVLAWAFVACYALSLGGMLGATGSRRAAVLAVVAAVSFCVISENWVHGALLVMFAVAGMGLFVATAWALARIAAWGVQQGQRPVVPAPAPRVAARPQPAAGMLRWLRRLQA